MAYRQAPSYQKGPVKTLYSPYALNVMSSGPPPAGPRFRIVAGRGLGEGRNQPPSQREQAAPSPQPPPQAELRVKYEQDSNVSSPSPIPHPQLGQVQYMGPMGPGSPLGPGGPQPDSGDAVVDKCTRFFKTLVNLAKSPEHQSIQHADGRSTSEKIHDLVVSVIMGHINPEQFTQILQDTLRSQAQPHLMPFLRRTLPAMRAALRARTVVVEGVDIPVEQLDQMQEDKYSPPPPSSHQPASVGMIPVSMGVPQTTSVPLQQQNTANPSAADVEMEENKAEDEAIHVRALQENVLKSAFIRPEDIMKKITERMKEACYVEEDVLTLLSDAVEYRLREILAELTVLAEHRMENLRASAVYAPIDDVKGQIRFLENMDRQQFEQSENREKEALIKLSKGKGMAKETIEKAKEMQRQDAEAKRNRDANAAAIAALSSKSVKPRWDSAAGTTVPVAGHGLRPKTIRINIRDFQAMANNDPLCSRTNIVHKLALGGGTQGEAI